MKEFMEKRIKRACLGKKWEGEQTLKEEGIK